MLLWLLTGLAVILAALAYVRERRLARHLDQLSQSYWELRYEYTRLRARIARLDPEQPPEEPPAPSQPSVSFVPLSSLKAAARTEER